MDIETNMVLLVPAGAKLPASLPYAADLAARRRQGPTGPDDEPLTTDLPNRLATRVTLATVHADVDAHTLLGLARRWVAPHRNPPSRRLTVSTHGLADALASRALEAVLAAALAADFDMPSFKTGQQPRKRLKTVALYGLPAGADLARSVAAARGNNLARYLTALPPNTLTPRSYRQFATGLARRQGWRARFIDQRGLARRGAGAFLAVAQGSPGADAGVLHLRYTPKHRARRPGLALVGKGICFDTGGTNLKTAKGMYGMHEDMAGSAVALGLLLALTELKVDFPVDCWLALAENHIGPRAYRQNEVVTAANGTSIEIVHTDAEGRMVLADTLSLAAHEQPRLVLDYATLTGACIGALGTRLSGALTNRPALEPIIMAAGRDSGERVWPFPLAADYAEELKSDIADIKQCTPGNDADQILAAVFLRRFLADRRGREPAWVHVDMAAGNHKGGLAHIPTDITGFGVRFGLGLLLDHNALTREL